MGKKIIGNLKMAHSWTSYNGSVCGILGNSGIFDAEPYLVSGMTGLAFHFIIRNDVCPSGPTVYDWGSEHFEMMDRIGVHSKQMCVYNMNLNTYDMIRRDAVDFIKESVDRGVGLVIWAPTILEFGIVKGYDDGDGVVYISDCMNENPDPILYENLGVSEVPYLLLQTFYSRVEVNEEKIFNDSLKYGVQQWNKEFHVPPFYASGRKAYEFLINALEKGGFNEFGLSYNMAIYCESKGYIKRYLRYILEKSSNFGFLENSLNEFEKIAECFEKVTELVPFAMPGTPPKSLGKGEVAEIRDQLKIAMKHENSAMDSMEKGLRK